MKAFAATLEEVQEADLLVHVIDLSNPFVREQMQADALDAGPVHLLQLPVGRGVVDEGDAAHGNALSARVFEKAKAEGAEAVVVSAAIEAEIATMAPEERGEFLSELGLEETGLARVITAGYKLLHLLTFFTVGPKEARAWTVHAGAKAPQAAGEIHTDFERGFIRAETIAFDDYVALKGEAGARDAGKLRQEGKEYVVHDGDVMLFRFNV